MDARPVGWAQSVGRLVDVIGQRASKTRDDWPSDFGCDS